ncbi:hypothetical protein OCK02_23210 [Rhizobium sp. TRM96647]|uniref:hypothetical protein n=1 Tax=unclassified Rhizobium TaxID=2613769 RepID=UPI0021E94C19|nr:MULTISPECIES: hypothetical protein [unclassified Rhizobium]MCV3739087.1 hypothetical protein [Rhizobium sp. TRM96647]MCV3760770.1 hypothetical protein [Rhizobium sp. TRM96650]
MTIHTANTPAGEVLRAATAASSTMSFAAGLASRRHFGEHFAVRAEPPVLRRHPHLVRYPDVEADFDALIDKAIGAISEGEPVEDEILGHYVAVASLVRAVSFREGKLLEQAVERLAKVNQNLVVLMQSIKLPLVKAAIEAVAGNDWRQLEGVRLDCEAPAKGSYTPDLIVVNKAKRAAFVLDLKRSLASYGDTSRLEELKLKMLASAMIVPDWLYKTQKRMMVETVGVAIIDGASRPSDHAAGVWALSEIDALLEIDGAAACMAELRLRFGRRVRQLLEVEARRALGLPETPMAMSAPVLAADASTTSLCTRRFGTLREIPRFAVCEDATDNIEDHGPGCRCGSCEDASFDDDDDGRGDPEALAEDVVCWPPEHIRIGFARRLLDV